MKKPLFIFGLAAVFAGCSGPDKKTETTSMKSSFTPPAWIKQGNVYEVNLRQYTPEGTINAFAAHLPRLKDMGVQTLWFMPITPIAQKNKKGSMGSYYAAGDYTSVAAEFGTVQDFKNLVKQAHDRGMKVIMDWVANHTGWDHVWTKEHPDWYLKDTSTNDFLIASGMDDIIELDFTNKEMRKAMIDAMSFWVKECDIDGFRADLAFWVELDFWIEARPLLDKIKPLFWLGEFDEPESADYMQAFDACYTWTWMHTAKDFYQNKTPIATLDTVLKRYDTAAGPGSMQLWFTTNHDENSWNGTEYEKYGDMAKALAVFSCTWSGLPLVYSGQELPNTKRLAFFEKDTIEWSGNNRLHDFYKILLNLRSNNPALAGGETETLPKRVKTSADDKVFAYLRKKGEHEVLVLLNFSAGPLKNVTLKGVELKGKFKELFSEKEFNLPEQSSFSLESWGYLVLEG